MRQEGEGLQTLERMARATGGIERVNLASIWSDLPRLPRRVSLAPWLLSAALVLLLAEVLQRRTGVFSLRLGQWAMWRNIKEAYARRTVRGRPATAPQSPAGKPGEAGPIGPKPASAKPAAPKPTAPQPVAPAAPAAESGPAREEGVIDGAQPRPQPGRAERNAKRWKRPE